jgi:hypothetical protein
MSFRKRIGIFTIAFKALRSQSAQLALRSVKRMLDPWHGVPIPEWSLFGPNILPVSEFAHRKRKVGGRAKFESACA